MAQSRRGAVAIWNDITAEGRANFYEWHGREHIPERVAIPGFLNGRRYVAITGSPEYFTLYETADADVLAGPDYTARLNAPSPWTLKSTAEFRNVARALCGVEFAAGPGSGGLIGTWRYELSGDPSAHRRQAISLLEGLADQAGVAGVHLLRTDLGSSSIDNEERKRRGEPNTIPGWIVMVEGWSDMAAFADRVAPLAAGLIDAGAQGDINYGLYALQSALYKSGAQPPRGENT